MGVTSGQRLRARDVRVLGFIILHDGKHTSEEVQEKIPEAKQFIRESLERLAYFGKIEFDRDGRLHARERAKRPPKTERALPADDVHRADTLAASNALRFAIAGPFPQLRKAAIAVLRSAFLRASTLVERAELLGVSAATLSKLRKDFPEYWEDAENRTAVGSVPA